MKTSLLQLALFLFPVIAAAGEPEVRLFLDYLIAPPSNANPVTHAVAPSLASSLPARMLIISSDLLPDTTRKWAIRRFLYTKADNSLHPTEMTLEEFRTKQGVSSQFSTYRPETWHIIWIEELPQGSFQYSIGGKCNNLQGSIYYDKQTGSMRLSKAIFNCCF